MQLKDLPWEPHEHSPRYWDQYITKTNDGHPFRLYRRKDDQGESHNIPTGPYALAIDDEVNGGYIFHDAYLGPLEAQCLLNHHFPER